MAKIRFRLAAALLLLVFCAVMVMQHVFLVRLHTDAIAEHPRAGVGKAKTPNKAASSVYVANPTDKASSSGTSGDSAAMVDSHVTVSATIHDRGTTRKPQFSYNDNEAKEGTHHLDLRSFEVVWVGNEPKIVKKNDLGSNVVVERSYVTARPLTAFETAGGGVMFTIRTTQAYHRKRLPVLFQTWLSRTNLSDVLLVTDGPDSATENRTRELGIEYVIAEACGSGHSKLCCKAGEELAVAFREDKQHIDWLCHVDDDMYVLINPLVRLLALFYPKTDPVYIGRAGTPWDAPYRVKRGSSLGVPPGVSFHFAVGGLYCLSRAMLARLRPYLGSGKAFSDSCSKALEPEDVTLGLLVGAVLNLTLSRTELIHTHGLHLSTQVDPQTLEQQVAVSYGFGATQWGNAKYNAICVPGSLYTVIEDETQFKSLHCLLYPRTDWCVKRKAWVEAHLGGRTRTDICKGW